MAKSTLYVNKSPFQLQMIEILKNMASEPIDENVIHLTGEFSREISTLSLQSILVKSDWSLLFNSSGVILQKKQ